MPSVSSMLWEKTFTLPDIVGDPAAWVCGVCDFALYFPIASYTSEWTVAGVYNDSRFPGRVIMPLRSHRQSLEELTESELSGMWADAVRVGVAIRRVTGAARVNYAVLGNAVPHVHVHLIPRFPEVESLPTRPPWLDPRPLRPLDESDLQNLLMALGGALADQGNS